MAGSEARRGGNSKKGGRICLAPRPQPILGPLDIRGIRIKTQHEVEFREFPPSPPRQGTAFTRSEIDGGNEAWLCLLFSAGSLVFPHGTVFLINARVWPLPRPTKAAPGPTKPTRQLGAEYEGPGGEWSNDSYPPARLLWCLPRSRTVALSPVFFCPASHARPRRHQLVPPRGLTLDAIEAHFFSGCQELSAPALPPRLL